MARAPLAPNVGNVGSVRKGLVRMESRPEKGVEDTGGDSGGS
jgi:hypothetical protein